MLFALELQSVGFSCISGAGIYIKSDNDPTIYNHKVVQFKVIIIYTKQKEIKKQKKYKIYRLFKKKIK